MHVPPAVGAYFEADRGGNADALDLVFSRDAVVEDEGVRHEGIDAIRAWWLAAKRRYHHIAEPLESSGEGSRFRVRAKVTGEFPNSPAQLEFLFTIGNARVVALKIG